jgi:hypothetical protein
LSSALNRLRPHPARGDTIAAGAVPLAAAALLIDERMTQWPLTARFGVVALISLLILTMGWLAPLEFDAPRSYHTILLVAGLLTLPVALILLSEVLGATRGHPGAGATFWTFGLESAIAATAARRANSAACTLIAAIAGTISIEAFVAFAFEPHGRGPFRAFIVVLSVGLIYGAVRLRDRRRAHAVQLVNAAGLLSLALAATLATGALASLLSTQLAAGFGGLELVPAGVGFGWKLYVLAIGFGLIAYAAADRQPGPAYLGVANVLAFALIDGLPRFSAHTLVGWPLLLLALGAIGLGVGLRAMTPLPPEPEIQPLPPRPPQEPE